MFFSTSFLDKRSKWRFFVKLMSHLKSFVKWVTRTYSEDSELYLISKLRNRGYNHKLVPSGRKQSLNSSFIDVVGMFHDSGS